MKKFALLLSLVASVPALAHDTHPDRQGRQFELGTVRLADRQDTDTIHLPPCGSSRNKPIYALRFEVRQNPAEIDRLRVTFHNGNDVELHVRGYFPQGSSSRWIDLPAGYRCVKTIRIVGDAETPRPHSRPSRITFFGAH